MRIITLTFNPAIDIHLKTDKFKICGENFVETVSRENGGKGVNASRALLSAACDNIAIVAVGADNGADFIGSLKKDGVNAIPVWVDGRIRENFTIKSSEGETRISFSGFSCGDEIFDEAEKIVGETSEEDIIAFMGSLPPGTSVSIAIETLKKFRKGGAKIVVDSRSLSFDLIEDIKPWLVKPNEEEAERYFGIFPRDEKVAASISYLMREKGVENAVVSLGKRGAVLTCASGTYYADAPKIDVLSTIGAGDSFIAGFIAGYSAGYDEEKTFKYASAFGAAACMREGTLPPLKKDADKIFEKLSIVKIK